MIRHASGRRITWLLLLASLCLLMNRTSAGGVSPNDHELPSARALPVELARDYHGTWQYKWGDSPRDANGAFTWLQAAHAAEFTSLGRPAVPKPAGRNGQRYLWLRTVLEGPEVHDPTFYVEIVDQLIEVYLDGQRIYTLGDLDGARRFLGCPVLYIPLGDDYRGRTLTLRIYSEHVNIGISGQLRIGSKSRLIIEALQQDIGKLAIGFVLCAIGLFVLVLFVSERNERAYLYYALFALNVGIWVLCQSRVRGLIIERQLIWPLIEIFSLYTAVAALTLFLSRAMGRGPLGLMPIIGWSLVAYDVGAALAVATRMVTVMATLLPFQLILGFGMLYTLIGIVILLRQGNIEARLFAVGLTLSVGFVGYDLLAAVGILPRVVLSMSYFGHGAFAVALGFILIRRFRLVHSDLVATKQTLSEKLQALQSRNAEVEQLNSELRHQIEARSKLLIDSLLGDSSGSAAPVALFAVGALLSDRYRVVRTLGQGAMGVVYEVERVQDGRHLAAKVLSGRAQRRDLARFAREAQVLARLKHKNLVTIADVNVTDSRLAYIIMELVPGTTLAEKTARYGDLGFVLPVLRQLADALATVHAEGVVHRDLKPANILITHGDESAEPMIKVVDFGVSALNASDSGSDGESENGRDDTNEVARAGKDFGTRDLAADETVSPLAKTVGGDRVSAGPLLTQTGVIMGTPLYMAPELIRGAKLARSDADIFSFGIIAYELITGQLPVETPPIMMLLKPHVRWYTPLSVRCPLLPANVADIIEKCLDAGPENRPTAAALYAAFSASRPAHDSGAAAPAGGDSHS